MNEQTQSKTNKLGPLAEDGRALMASATSLANETMGVARERLNDAVATGKDLIADWKETTTDRVKAIDQALRERPYQTLAIVAGVGLLLGFLFARSRSGRAERE